MGQGLRQADERWSSILLGDGPGRIGRSGCLLVVLTQAARHMGTRPDLLPPHLNEQARQAHAFKGDRLVVPDAARLVGLVTDPATWTNAAHTPEEHRQAITGSLGGGAAAGCCILHVDHDETKPGGDLEGDHFVLGVELSGPPARVICADPATGRMEWIGWDDLQGAVLWGKATKRYRVRGVRPLRVAS